MVEFILNRITLELTDLLVCVGVFIAGSVLSFFIWQLVLKRRSDKIIAEAENEAEVLKKEKILQAKEKFFQLKSEHEKYIGEKNNKIAQAENRIKQKEFSLSQKLEETQRKNNELDAIRENLNNQLDIIDKRGEELNRLHKPKPCLT